MSETSNVKASLDQMAAFDSRASQALEAAMKQYAELNEKRVRAAANIERLEADIAEMQKRMQEEYGCATPEELLDKVRKMQESFRKEYAKFWAALQNVKTEMDAPADNKDENNDLGEIDDD